MIRVATLADAEPIARLHVCAWQSAYRGVVSDNLLDTLSVDSQIPRWEEILSAAEGTTLVCEGASIAGWISFGKGRDQNFQNEGEIFALYVDPAHWRAGVGRRLMREAELLLRNEFSRFYLWVLASNARARSFYESVGYNGTESIKTISLAGSSLSEVRYIKSGGPV